jgi:predicted amidophosphoribosyltransferase
MAEAPSCLVCGRPTYDPDKRERPWARGARGGHQVLVCPRCQAERTDWPARLDTCPSCGSTRLSVTLGEVTCRSCGHAWPAG